MPRDRYHVAQTASLICNAIDVRKQGVSARIVAGFEAKATEAWGLCSEEERALLADFLGGVRMLA